MDSVRDCMANFPQTLNGVDRNNVNVNWGRNLQNEGQNIGSNFIFGMSTNVLNKKNGRLFSENATVEEIMTRSGVQKKSLADHDMTSQRTREEVT